MGEKVINSEVEELLSELKSRYVDEDLNTILSAYDMAYKGHLTQKRKSGEPYIIHPLSVAIYLSDLSMDIETVTAALLHDLIEDTDITYENIKDSFGTDVANIVDGVTKLDRIRYNTKEEAKADAIRKMVVAMSKDIRVLILKLADRLHNIETLEHLNDWKQEKIANETLYVYAPLAHRLGLQNIKHTLEDTSFEILFKKQHLEIENLIEKASPHRNSEIDKTTKKDTVETFQIPEGFFIFKPEYIDASYSSYLYKPEVQDIFKITFAYKIAEINQKTNIVCNGMVNTADYTASIRNREILISCILKQ